MTGAILWLLIAVAFVAANLPWISDRAFLFRSPDKGKSLLLRWLEWGLLLVLVWVLAAGFEQKLYGEIYQQGWEFFAVGTCLFLVFALPGFVYRFELRHRLERNRTVGG